MQRGTLAHCLKSEKEMSIAQDILKDLAKQNLTIFQVRIILELAQWLVNNAKFSDPVPQDSADSDSDNLIQCPSCNCLSVPDGNSCANCGGELSEVKPIDQII